MPPARSPILFSTINVTSQVFHLTPHTACFVNLRPLLPGHTLIIPLLPASAAPPPGSSPPSTPPAPPTFARLTTLPPSHLTDLFLTAQLTARMLQRVYGATGINWGVQDGASAGQSVPHVHVHLIPRGGEGEQDVARQMGGEEADRDGVGDKIYEMLESWDGSERRKMPVVEDCERVDRSAEEMEREAKWLRREMEEQVRIEAEAETQ